METLEFVKTGIYNFNTLTEDVCKSICEVHDNGERYSRSSRYNYHYKDYKHSKSGFSFGTAKACVQSYLIDNKKTDQNFNIHSDS